MYDKTWITNHEICFKKLINYEFSLKLFENVKEIECRLFFQRLHIDQKNEMYNRT